MERKITYQKLKRIGEDRYSIALKYYAIISILNNLGLTERELQLVAFAAVRGNMSSANVREDFCKKYNTSFPTINNIISKMKKLGVFVKERGKVKVNPVILLDFEKNIVLQISFVNG